MRLRTKVSLLPSFSKLESPAGDRPPRAGMRRGSAFVFDAVRRRAAVSLRHRFLSASVLAFCVLTALPDGAGAQTAPAKPTGFRTEDGNIQVRLRWTGPDDPTITEWQYAYKPDDGASYSDWTGMEGSGPDTRRYTVTGLANNRTYKFKIRAVNAIGPSRESDGKTGDTYNKLPDKPAGFQAIPGDRKALLIWNDADDVSIWGWEYRQNRSGSWMPIPGSDASTTSYTVAGLENGTEYTFELKAYNSAGNGYISDAETVTPMPAAPGKPTGFSVEAGNRKAVLTWDDPGNDTITKWQYAYRSMSGDSGWTDIAGSGPLTVRHVVSMLENDTLYAFRIRAVNRIGAGADSGEVSATPATRAPEKPAGLKALAGDREVVLSWTATSDASISKWQYHYKTTNDYGRWIDIPGSGAATTSYTVLALVNGAAYVFQLRAVNEVGNGPESDETFATPLSIPAKPSGFRIAAGDARVVLGWDNPLNTTISGWQYSYKTSGDYGAWTDIAGSDADTTGYTVAGLANDVEHVFRIRALNASGYGAGSDGLAATTRPAPAKPSGLRAVAGNTQVRLVWTDPHDYSIARWQYRFKTTADYGAWTDIPGSGAATARHTVTGLSNNVVHFLRIRAVNGSGAGPESDEASATPRAAAPARPTGFRAESGDGKAVLKWDYPDDSSIEGWQYKGRKSGGDYKAEWNNIPDSGAKTVQHTVTGLKNGRTYLFKLRAVNETNGYESDERPVTPRSPRPSAPTGLIAAAGDGRIALTWNDPGDATITGWQYNVRTTGDFGEWTDIPDSAAATTAYTVIGLDNGARYALKLRAVNYRGGGAESGEVSATPIAVPARPAGFEATPGDGQVTLTWDDPNDATITGWQYSYGTTGSHGSWTDIPGSHAETTGHTVTGLNNGIVHRFRVRAINTSGHGAESDEAAATPLPVPAKPTGVTAAPGDGQVRLDWDDPNDPTITGWRYSYRTTDGYGFWIDLPGSGAVTTSYTVVGLENGVSHAFKLCAVNASGSGMESVEAVATPIAVPAKPTGLTATPGDRRVLMEWDDPSDPTITDWEYNLRRAGGAFDEDWTHIPGSDAATTSYTVVGLENSGAYRFKLRAVNASGSGSESDEVAATPVPVPAKPTGVTATPGDGQVFLEWAALDDPTVTGWRYSYRMTGGYGSWIDIPDGSAATTSYTVIGLKNGVSHAFKLRAVNASGNGVESVEAAATPIAVPAKPTGLTATSGDGRVLLEWDDPNDPTITGWEYSYRTTGSNGPWVDIPGGHVATTGYTVTDLDNGTVHRFKIRAINTSGSGAESDEAAATPLPIPAKPTGITATPGDGQAVLTWDNPNDPTITGWQYSYRTTAGYRPWIDIPGSNAATASYTVVGLENGVSHAFKLRAVNASGSGMESVEAAVTPAPVPARPTGVIAAPGDGQVVLTWDNPNDPTITSWQYSYNATGGYGRWIGIPGSHAETTDHTVTGLDNSTPHIFRIRAVNSSGNGVESIKAAATPIAVPAKPTGLTAAPGDGQARLEWDDPNDPTVAGWQYSYRTTGSHGPWIGIPDGHAGTINHTVAGLNNGAAYHFKVRAVNPSGDGTESDEAAVTPIAVPVKPTGLTATPGDGQVFLEWSALDDPTVTGWQYSYRTTGGYGSWIDIPGSHAATTGYTVASLDNSTPHIFRIRAVNSSGNSIESDEATTTPIAVPAKPTGLTATPGDGRVLLEWDDPGDPTITGWEYNLRQEGEAFEDYWTHILGSSAATTRYTVSGLENGVSHAFKLRAANASGSGIKSFEAAATPVPVPAGPTGVSAAPGDGQVMLTWDDPNDPTVTGWQYSYRTTDGYGSWIDIPGSSAATTSYTVIGLENGVSHAFRLRALNASGSSMESDEAAAIPIAVPAKPTGLTATPGDGRVLLAWDDPGDMTITGWEYNLRQAGGAFEEHWTHILGSSAATTRYSVIGLETGVSYAFKVRAVSNSRVGAESEEANVILPPVPVKPTGVTATPGDGQVFLEWAALDDLTVTGWQYSYRTTGGYGRWLDIPDSNAAATSHRVTGLDNRIPHTFRVRAVNSSGHGVESDETTVVPFAVPAKPTGFTATPGSGQVLLEWNDLDDPTITAWQYNQRRLDGEYEEEWTNILGSTAATTKYTVTSLDAGVSYGFKVRALSMSGIGAESDEAVSALPPVPAQPEGLAAAAGDREAVLTWKLLGDPTVTLWQYSYRTTGGHGNWIDIPGSGANTAGYTVTGLAVGVSHTFRIRAANSSGEGAESGEARRLRSPFRPSQRVSRRRRAAGRCCSNGTTRTTRRLPAGNTTGARRARHSRKIGRLSSAAGPQQRATLLSASKSARLTASRSAPQPATAQGQSRRKKPLPCRRFRPNPLALRRWRTTAG